jgi:hypothetical protein
MRSMLLLIMPSTLVWVLHDQVVFDHNSRPCGNQDGDITNGASRAVLTGERLTRRAITRYLACGVCFPYVRRNHVFALSILPCSETGDMTWSNSRTWECTSKMHSMERYVAHRGSE